MADAFNHHQNRRNARKSTSKRRILGNSKRNSSSNQSTKLQVYNERKVIGAEKSTTDTSNGNDLNNITPDKCEGQINGKGEKLSDFYAIRSEADGSEEINDGENEELSRLRCASICTEAIAEREKNRRQRCADYPGLAFGFSVFSSDTLMKFSVIRNELHNILKSQLKRTENEVTSLYQRIEEFEQRLKESEEQLVSTSIKLAEASQEATECEQFRKEIEDRNSMENDRVGIIENQLYKARLLAEQADQRYEEVLINVAQNMDFLSRTDSKS